MFSQLIADASQAGEFPDTDPVLAMSHFSGLMLNIPRLINEGTLAPPALQYVDAVYAAVRGVFGLSATGDGRRDIIAVLQSAVLGGRHRDPFA